MESMMRKKGRRELKSIYSIYIFFLNAKGNL